jgi:DNA invertase Pin-like site-specific DNA recombinase
MPDARSAVAYYRVSTQKQGASGLGLEAQQEAVQAHAARVGLTIVQAFTEIETGTRKRERVEIHKAIEAARKHGAVLLIGKLDRLARSVSFISSLMDAGVDFVAVDMPDANRLTVHIMVALAEHEARLISTRTKDALQQARKRGKKLGSPQNLTLEDRLSGARANQDKAVQADRRVSGYIKELRSRGCSLRTIAARLNDEGFRTRRGREWSPVQVKRVLERASYP